MTGSWQHCRTGHGSLRLLSGEEGDVGSGAGLNPGRGWPVPCVPLPETQPSAFTVQQWSASGRIRGKPLRPLPPGVRGPSSGCVGTLHTPSGHLTHLKSHPTNLPHPVAWDKENSEYPPPFPGDASAVLIQASALFPPTGPWGQRIG